MQPWSFILVRSEETKHAAWEAFSKANAEAEAMFPDERTLGVMLPNANGTAATVLGVMSAGKVPAMLNFTAGAANILSACRAAEVRREAALTVEPNTSPSRITTEPVDRPTRTSGIRLSRPTTAMIPSAVS